MKSFLTSIIPGLCLLLVNASTVTGAQKCWIPMICDGRPLWYEFSEDNNEIMQAILKSRYAEKLKEMTDRVGQLNSGVAEFEEKMDDVKRSEERNTTATDVSSTAPIDGMSSSAETTSQPEPTSPTQPMEVTTAEWCLQAFNGIPYNDTCLWAEHVSAEFHLRNTDALTICNRKALSKLPDVYDENEFNQITQYMRSKIPPSNKGRVLAWTGMKRDHSTGKALLSNGDPALYTKPTHYKPEWETAAPTSTTVYLYTDRGGAMGALNPNFAFIKQPKIVLCQKI